MKDCMASDEREFGWQKGTVSHDCGSFAWVVAGF